MILVFWTLVFAINLRIIVSIATSLLFNRCLVLDSQLLHTKFQGNRPSGSEKKNWLIDWNLIAL